MLGTMKDPLADSYIGPLFRKCEKSLGARSLRVDAKLRLGVSSYRCSFQLGTLTLYSETGSIFCDRDRPRRGAANDRYPIWIHDRLEELLGRIGKI